MNDFNDQFYLVPKQILERILEGNDKILSRLNAGEFQGDKLLPGDYISEAEAKKLLNKKTTWFWKMRTSGYLPSSKVGGKNYYRKQDIQKLLDSAFTGNLK